MAIDMNEDVSLTLKAHEWQTVMNALAEIPWRISDPLITNIKRQFEELDGNLNPPMPAAGPSLPARRNGSGRPDDNQIGQR